VQGTGSDLGASGSGESGVYGRVPVSDSGVSVRIGRGSRLTTREPESHRGYGAISALLELSFSCPCPAICGADLHASGDQELMLLTDEIPMAIVYEMYKILDLVIVQFIGMRMKPPRLWLSTRT
jgi:hypothetical protein